MPGWCGDLKHAAALGAGMWHLHRPCQTSTRQLARGTEHIAVAALYCQYEVLVRGTQWDSQGTRCAQASAQAYNSVTLWQQQSVLLFTSNSSFPSP